MDDITILENKGLRKQLELAENTITGLNNLLSETFKENKKYTDALENIQELLSECDDDDWIVRAIRNEVREALYD